MLVAVLENPGAVKQLLAPGGELHGMYAVVGGKLGLCCLAG